MAATQDAKRIDADDTAFEAGVRVVPPAVRLLDEIHAAAIAARCSDIHFEPCVEGGMVRVRRDGALHELRTVGADVFSHVVSRVKILSGMDIAERRVPQDGRYTFSHAQRAIEARSSTIPTICGEKIVVRLFDQSVTAPALEDIGMLPATLRAVQRALAERQGLIVISGPTGSGKTTTLYACVTHQCAGDANICTIEDPVELRLAGTSQVQVNERAGVTFASALRAFLRQDPDMIMVGELRDGETATLASSASLTGVLIGATLHASDVISAIGRLRELGVNAQTLAAGLNLVVSQRLYPVACSRHTSNCQTCGGTGVIGRSAVFETLTIDEEMRAQIARDEPLPALRRYALSTGFATIESQRRSRGAA